MSNNPQNAILLQKKPTFVQRAKDAAFVGAVTGSALMLTSGANAASSLDFTGASGELDGVKLPSNWIKRLRLGAFLLGDIWKNKHHFYIGFLWW